MEIITKPYKSVQEFLEDYSIGGTIRLKNDSIDVEALILAVNYTNDTIGLPDKIYTLQELFDEYHIGQEYVVERKKNGKQESKVKTITFPADKDEFFSKILRRDSNPWWE